MKKIVSIISILMIISIAIFTGNVYAAPLNSVNVEVNKSLVRPGEEVRVNVDFGQALGSYTVDVAYDNSIYVLFVSRYRSILLFWIFIIYRLV